MGEICAVISGKGGTGRTTVTAGIGEALARRNVKTLLVDLNFLMDDLPALFQAENRVAYHLLDIIEGNCKIIQAMIPVGESGFLHLLPASSERELKLIPKTSFIKLLEMMKSSFDYVLIDTPAGFSDGTDYALAAADSAILVTTADRISVRDTGKILKHPGFNGVHECFIVNRFEKRLLKEGAVLSPEKIAEETGIPVLGLIPEDEELLLSSGEGLLPDSKRAVSVKSFDNIAGRLLGEEIPISLKR